MKTKTVSMRDVRESGELRVDPGYYATDAVHYFSALKSCKYDITSVREEASNVYWGGVFTRRFVPKKEFGVPYITASSMVNTDLSGVKLLSKKQEAEWPELRIQEGTLLISCSGTPGIVIYADRRFVGKHGSQNLIRVVPAKRSLEPGVLYAFLTSKFGYACLTHSKYGSVVQHINPEHVASIRIPVFPEAFQRKVHQLIVDSARLREEADAFEKNAQLKLREFANLEELSQEDYNYFGPRSAERKTSCFFRRKSEISTLTINAFNYSERTTRLIERIRSRCKCISIAEALDEKGFFSSGAFPRVEIDSPKSVLLINQSDIFNQKLCGKKIARRGVKEKSFVKYGEVIIAGVGTLGENETFCRVLFANEKLVGQLISGEFIRMNTNEKIPSGYLYAWLHSDYGFRLIRMTQAGTKLCRPIQKMLLEMPIPLLERSKMDIIDGLVRNAQTKLADAAEKENEAIGLVEREIESWQAG